MQKSVENSIAKANALFRIELIVFVALGLIAFLGFYFFKTNLFKGIAMSILPLMIFGVCKEYIFCQKLKKELQSNNSISEIRKKIKRDFVRELNYFDIMTFFFATGLLLCIVGVIGKYEIMVGGGVGITLFAGLIMTAHVISNYILEILCHELGRGKQV